MSRKSAKWQSGRSALRRGTFPIDEAIVRATPIWGNEISLWEPIGSSPVRGYGIGSVKANFGSPEPYRNSHSASSRGINLMSADVQTTQSHTFSATGKQAVFKPGDAMIGVVPVHPDRSLS
jgi:hypothetical protein